MARDEARKLKWDDIAVIKEANDEEKLVFMTKRGTKTHTGEKPHGSKRKFDPPAYATGTKCCPFGSYRFFEALCPKEMNEVVSRFYLAINTRGWKKSKISWYLKTPLRKSTTGSFLPEARAVLDQDTGSSSCRVSNHSCRNTGITWTMEADVPPHLVAQLSGHKRVKSLQSYHSASKKRQKRMSDILSYGNESAAIKQLTLHRFISKHHVHKSSLGLLPQSRRRRPVKSLDISDDAATNVQSGSSTSYSIGAPSNRLVFHRI